MANPVTTASGLAAAGSLAGLCVVGAVSWRRTGSIRRGRPPAGERTARAAGGRTSPATWMAAAAGGSVALWALAGSASVPVRLAVGGWGAFVLVTGCVRRVVSIRATPRQLVVERATGRAAVIAWDELASVHPPPTPLGAWRVRSSRATLITLMPSDLLGHEAVLQLAASRGGLRWRDGAWARAADGARGPPAVRRRP